MPPGPLDRVPAGPVLPQDLALGQVADERQARYRIPSPAPGCGVSVGNQNHLVSAKLVAAMATRQREVTASELVGADKVAWRRLRAAWEERRQRRVDRHRFRRDPEGSLRDLDAKLNQPGVPPEVF
jgi:hypothetical protein